MINARDRRPREDDDAVLWPTGDPRTCFDEAEAVRRRLATFVRASTAVAIGRSGAGVGLDHLADTVCKGKRWEDVSTWAVVEEEGQRRARKLE